MTEDVGEFQYRDLVTRKSLPTMILPYHYPQRGMGTVDLLST